MNKAVAITGATSGIGLEAARILAERGYFVIGIGRDGTRCQAAQAELGGERCRYICCDISNNAGAKRAASGIRNVCGETGCRLACLINNAGAYTSRYTQNDDGFELQFATNYLAAFTITHELLDLLQSGRVIFVGSNSHYGARLNLRNLMLRRCYIGLIAYRRSKLALVMLAAHMNRHGLARCFVADPGLAATSIGYKRAGAFSRLVWRIKLRFADPPQKSAGHIADIASGLVPFDAQNFYLLEGKVKPPNRQAYNLDKCCLLYTLSLKFMDRNAVINI